MRIPLNPVPQLYRDVTFQTRHEEVHLVLLFHAVFFLITVHPVSIHIAIPVRIARKVGIEPAAFSALGMRLMEEQFILYPSSGRSPPFPRVTDPRWSETGNPRQTFVCVGRTFAERLDGMWDGYRAFPVSLGMAMIGVWRGHFNGRRR